MAVAELPHSSSTETWMGLSIKKASLITLTIQNSTLILILHYSRQMPLVGGRRYITSTAVFLNELLKFTVCSSIALYDTARTSSPALPATSLFGKLINAVFTGDSWKLAIPACLYVLQSSLQYVAISNLDSATYQVTYQFKILPTALFSVLLLRKKLSARKWIALALLMFGVAIVQIPTDPTSLVTDTPSRMTFPRSLLHWRSNPGHSSSSPFQKRSATYEGIAEDEGLVKQISNTPLGLTAAISGCVVSAAASVYFERIVKDATTPVSLWTRNVQLSFYSLFPALFIGVVFVDGEEVAQYGFLSGYNWVVWVTVAFQALGGILISLCVTYADNIAKSFAICISILISLCVSIWFFDFILTRNFLIGTSIVLFATYLYNSSERSHRPPPIRIHSYEKTTVDSLSTDEKDATQKKPATPVRNEGHSSSRPGSPSGQRRPGSARGFSMIKHQD